MTEHLKAKMNGNSDILKRESC